MSMQNVDMARVSARDLRKAAGTMRALLAELPAEGDTPRDAAVRRRIEGAIVAAELAADDRSKTSERIALHDTDV